MGGRKPYSIKEVIRKTSRLGPKKANLTKAYKKEDINGITRSSIGLLPEHRDITKIFVYSEKLLNRIVKKYTPEETKTVKQIVPKIRSDWSTLKREQSLDSNTIIDNAVIYSVGNYLKERNK